jgi:hypothetical protein
MATVKYKLAGMPGYGLMMHNPAGSMKRSSEGMGKKTIPTPEEEAEAGTYRMEDGTLYVPSHAIRGAILNATIGMKIGKRAARLIFASALFTSSEQCALFTQNGKSRKPITKFRIDTRRAVVQRSGVLRSRPILDEWACEVEFNYDEDFLSLDNIDMAIERAGKIAGLLEYRPERTGPYGRFTAERL